MQLVADPKERTRAVQAAILHPARWAEVLALTVSQLGSEEADTLVRARMDADEAGRSALYRVLASAEGLHPETVQGALKLEVGWERKQLQARQKVIEEIPTLVKDLAVAVGLLEQVAKSTTCGHDLFWVREVLRRIERGEVKGDVLDGSAEEAKRAAKGSADNVLRHLSTERRAALLALLKPWWRPIPAGSFEMGSNEFIDARPIHRVTFTSGFWMLGVPVTCAMYRIFDPNHDAAIDGFGGNLTSEAQDEVPVYDVSLFASVMFVEWVNARLPLESEWEYACRAGTSTRFWSGETKEDLARVGWILQNSEQHLHSVAKKPPNAWGLYDVHGNVEEWCVDIYEHEDYLIDDKYDLAVGFYRDRSPGLTIDPVALTVAIGFGLPESAMSNHVQVPHVVRGESLESSPMEADAAHRSRIWPSDASRNLGFRLLLCPPDPP